MDPLSVTASVIAVYQISYAIAELCFNYSNSVAHAKRDIEMTLDEIMNFQRSLFRLKGMLEAEAEAKVASPRLAALSDLFLGDSAMLKHCRADLEKLKIKLEEASKRQGVKALLTKLKWPFKEEEIKRTVEGMRNVSAAIDRAQSLDTTQMVRDIDDTTKENLDLTKRIERKVVNAEEKREKEEEEKRLAKQKKDAAEEKEKVIAWLKKHSDPYENHNIACKARNEAAKTGRWFTEGEHWNNFTKTPRSLLWLHGEPGCGKTILSATAIETLLTRRRENSSIMVAFWYFNLDDSARTNLDACVRALLTQFIQGFPENLPSAIIDLYIAKQRGAETPKTSDLIVAFSKLLADEAGSFFIVLDALDEASKEAQEGLFPMIQTLASIDGADVHILVSSRPQIKREFDEISLNKINFFDVVVERANVDVDIEAHVREKLQNDEILKKWPEKARQKILDRLLQRADGMFRWVDCQLAAIRKCKKPSALDRILDQLPKDLSEQYRRDLANIPDFEAEDALTLLKWLVFPLRKLRIEEAKDLLAVDLDEAIPIFNKDDRLFDPNSILEICGSLLRIDFIKDGRNEYGEIVEVTTITTSHATVLDFLKANPVKIANLPEEKFDRATVNLQMAETALGYLLSLFDDDVPWNEETLSDYPFARSCAESWDDYYREILKCEENVDMGRLHDMAFKLFDSRESTLKWVQLCNPDDDTARVDFNFPMENVHSPIYYASLLGLTGILEHYIDNGQDINYTTTSNMETPLVAACINNHQDVVKLLLKKGADSKLAGYYFWGCPLAAAVECDHVNLVKILLDEKDVEINCIRYSGPAFSDDSDEDSVDGKDLNEFTTSKPEDNDINQGVVDDSDDYENFVEDETSLTDSDTEDIGDGGSQISVSVQSMLYICAAYDSPNALCLLIEKGADPNIIGGYYGTALQAACAHGREEMAEQLLKCGAKADIYAGHLGSALIAACYGCSSSSIVIKLIEAGCNVNHEGGPLKCALQTAVQGSKLDIVKTLLENGANPNVDGCGTHNTPLQLALANGNEAIVRLLLDFSADVSSRGGLYGNCLQAAVHSGKCDLVTMMLERGISANEEGGPYVFPLVKASVEAHEDIVKILLEHGADPNLVGNTPDYEGIAAIQFASTEGIAKVLLDAGAQIDHQSTKLSSCLWRATQTPNVGLIRLLLEKGADPYLAHKENVAPVLENGIFGLVENMKVYAEFGVDINLVHQNDWGYRTVLYVAIIDDQPEMVRWLLDNGADVHQNDWREATVLTTAAIKPSVPILKMLAAAGATENETNLIGQNALLSAAMEGQLGSMRCLLDLGFDHEFEDMRGCNALHYAAAARNSSAIELLLERGLNKDCLDNNGWTALHWAAACSKGSSKAIAALLKAGANRTVLDKQNRTPLDYALGYGKQTEAVLLGNQEVSYNDLLPDVDGYDRQVWGQLRCDGCDNSRGNRYTCQSCDDFDLCSRCLLDKDAIHFAGHEFKLEVEDSWIDVQPTVEATSIGTKPTYFQCLNKDMKLMKREGEIYIIKTTLQVRGERAYLRADAKFSPGNMYFEVTIIDIADSNRPEIALGIGVSTGDVLPRGMVGWERDSYGWHSDDGHIFNHGKLNFHTEYDQGDTVGCGIDPTTRSIFFTKNGKHLGNFVGVKAEVFPTITGKGSDIKFTVNFGEQDFMWKGDIWDGTRIDSTK